MVGSGKAAFEKISDLAEVQRLRTLPARSISCIEQTKPPKEEKIRRTPHRTSSMPKRTVWKDKGGLSRYVLRDEPPPAEVKPVGLETVAKEALTEAVITGGVAALAVLDAVTATKRHLDRQLSQRWSSSQEASNRDDDNTQSKAGNKFAQGGLGLMRRAKSLGTMRGSGNSVAPCRQPGLNAQWG